MTFVKLQIPTAPGMGQAPQPGQPAPTGVPAPAEHTTDGVQAFAANDLASAATAPGSQPDASYWWTALGLIVLGVVAGTLLYGPGPTGQAPPPAVSPFAGLYVAAQALERLGEFISLIPGLGDQIGATTVGTQRMSKRKAITDRNLARKDTLRALKQGNNHLAAQKAADAAQNQHATDVIRANRSVFFWGLNSLLASLLVGVLKLDILYLIGITSGGGLLLGALHVSVTGLAVGGGTKPLHDLIANLQQNKEEKQDQASGGAGSS
jgi:hypothetical protein